MFEKYLNDHINRLKGSVGIYYKNLVTGSTLSVNADKGFTAASMIKVPILAEAFHQIENMTISGNGIVTLCDSDKQPSCGALSYMHSGLEVTIEDLCNLMIVLSDNTAANILIKRLGLNNINGYIHELGLNNIVLGRLLFDQEADRKGRKNIVSARNIGNMFELLWQGKLVSPEASRKMLDLLRLQQLNHKIPAMLDETVAVAHKTGEDAGITHDAGIIYCPRPFILCVLSEATDVFETNTFISNLAYQMYLDNNIR